MCRVDELTIEIVAERFVLISHDAILLSEHTGNTQQRQVAVSTVAVPCFLCRSCMFLYVRTEEREDGGTPCKARSEEHTSELQSLMRISYAVFCLKKKKT